MSNIPNVVDLWTDHGQTYTLAKSYIDRNTPPYEGMSAEDAYEAGVGDGTAEGYEDGKDDGYDDGHCEGYKECFHDIDTGKELSYGLPTAKRVSK